MAETTYQEDKFSRIVSELDKLEWLDKTQGKVGDVLAGGRRRQFREALAGTGTDEKSYQAAIDKVIAAKKEFGMLGKLGSENYLKGAVGDSDVFEQKIGQLRGNLAKYQIGEFKKEARASRDLQAITLEQDLSGLATREFETLFKPQIRQSLNARGLLGSGAEAEVGARTQAGLQGKVFSDVSKYRQDTEEFDQKLSLQQVVSDFEGQREGVVAGFQDVIAQSSNALASELANITRPGFIDYFGNASQIAGIFGAFKGMGSNQSGGSSGLSSYGSGLNLPEFDFGYSGYSKATAGKQGGLQNSLDSGPFVA